MNNIDFYINYCEEQIEFYRSKSLSAERDEKMLTYYTTKLLCFTEFLEILEIMEVKGAN